MSQTAGPILATGAITVVNTVVFNGAAMDWRVPLATGLAALGFGLMERVSPQIAEILAWTTLITVLLTRVQPTQPSPVENAVTWWNRGGSS